MYLVKMSDEKAINGNFNRLGVGYPYWEISKINYKKYKKFKKKYDAKPFPDEAWNHKHRKTEDKRDRAGTIAIVFSAIYLEAEIYNFLASCLTDSYTTKHLDKLDPLSKWLVGLQLVTGETISKESQAYEYCKKLFSYRNSIVHSKSRPMIWDHDKILERINHSEKRFDEMVHNSNKAVIELAKEVNTLIKGHKRPLAYVIKDKNTFYCN